MTRTEKLVTGFILVAVGLFMFAKETSIYTTGYLSRFSTVPAILLVLFVASIVLYIILKRRFVIYVIIAELAGLFVALLLGVRMSFYGSLLSLILIIVPISVGAGFLASGFLKKSISAGGFPFSVTIDKPNQATMKAIQDSFQHPERGKHYDTFENFMEDMNAL